MGGWSDVGHTFEDIWNKGVKPAGELGVKEGGKILGRFDNIFDKANQAGGDTLEGLGAGLKNIGNFLPLILMGVAGIVVLNKI